MVIGCLLLVLPLSGCAAVVRLKPPWVPLRIPSTEMRPDDGYEDYVGVIHVHTTYSHDADGTFRGVVRAANAQGLDYVILTEHNTLQPLRDGLQGWHGAVLVLIGMEISASDGHYLGFNVTEEIDRDTLTSQGIIDAVNQQGGFGAIAHPYFENGRWKDWAVTGFTGMEIYNVAHDTFDENIARLIFWGLAATPIPFYLSIVDRPYDPLRTWDEMIRRHGRVVGIGSVDAHEIHVFNFTFAPYDVMFRLARTHVLVADESLTVEAVYEALRQGHAYVSLELLVTADGFSFMAERGQKVVGIMGDEVAWHPDLQLLTWVPVPSDLTLFKDGHAWQSTSAKAWSVPVEEPGVYRIEVMRHGKPWIISNPIYVRAPSAPTEEEEEEKEDTKGDGESLDSPEPLEEPLEHDEI